LHSIEALSDGDSGTVFSARAETRMLDAPNHVSIN
jgi:hypothetical protein